MFVTPQAESSVAATAATVVVTAAPIESAATGPTAVLSAAVAAGTCPMPSSQTSSRPSTSRPLSSWRSTAGSASLESVAIGIARVPSPVE